MRIMATIHGGRGRGLTIIHSRNLWDTMPGLHWLYSKDTQKSSGNAGIDVISLHILYNSLRKIDHEMRFRLWKEVLDNE